MPGHNTNTQAAPRLVSITRKRGRPKTERPMHDSGTAELVMKRLRGETTEALDLCYERNLISRNQHWCGVHLRWLYTLRFGAPGIRAVDPTHLGGTDLKLHDTVWVNAREQEYQEALATLSRSGHAALVMSVYIFNERPAFLSRPVNLKSRSDITETLAEFCSGLDILGSLWCGNKKHSKTI